MTKEEIQKVLDLYLEYYELEIFGTDKETETPTLVDWIYERMKNYSLPSNLFEAKLAFSERRFPEEKMAPLRRAARIGYEAGAEWMAEQGYTTECTVDRTPLNGPAGICMNLHDYTGFKIGDKVIVQIRKKDD